MLCRESDEHPADLDLFPGEAVVARAVDKRRREFAAYDVAPVRPTRCAGDLAVAVAPAARVASIGIDAELYEPLPDGVLKDIALAEERQRADALLADLPEIRWDRLLFSVKESVYKCWFPLTGRWLDVAQARVHVGIERRARGPFSVRLLTPGSTVRGEPLLGFEGRWTVANGLVVTGIAVVAQATLRPGCAAD